MNILLDTHTLIWFLNGDEKLSETVKKENALPICCVKGAIVEKIKCV